MATQLPETLTENSHNRAVDKADLQKILRETEPTKSNQSAGAKRSGRHVMGTATPWAMIGGTWSVAPVNKYDEVLPGIILGDQ